MKLVLLIATTDRITLDGRALVSTPLLLHRSSSQQPLPAAGWYCHHVATVVFQGHGVIGTPPSATLASIYDTCVCVDRICVLLVLLRL